MSPWVQAKLGLARAGIVAQAAGVAQVAGLFEAKTNQFGSANGVNVGVRAGSAVTMWRAFIPVWSAWATMIPVSSRPVYGFVQWSWLISRSRFRVEVAVWDGLPVIQTFGASSEWTVKAVVSPNWVRTIALRLALISPTLA